MRERLPLERHQPVLTAQPKGGRFENFSLAFERKFMPAVVARMEANDEIVKRIPDNEQFGDAVREHLLNLVYTRLRDAA